MKKRVDQKIYFLILAALILTVALILFIYRARTEKNVFYNHQVQASEKMQQLLQAVKEYKHELNIPISEEDKHHTGLIGARYSGITTTLGDPAAKRTACHPDMAALIVKMFYDAGLVQGDTVAASLSGSFPGFNLALLAACEELEINLKYICSVGSSMYGSNDESLTFPEIAYRLYQDQFTSSPPVAISMGGDRDMGDEMIQEIKNNVRERVRLLPIFYLEEGNFAKNLEKRRNLYGDEKDLDAFVSIGGHTSSLGHDERSIDLGQGILQKKGGALGPFQAWKLHINDKSGLIQYYLSRGVAVFNILNVKRIVSDYGLPFDPVKLNAEIGTSAIYYRKTYNQLAIILTLMIVSGLLITYSIFSRLDNR